VVNAGSSLGASGFETNLAPTMTIGTGFFGRSSAAENVGPQHLVQWVKLAWNKDARIAMPSFGRLETPRAPHVSRSPRGAIDYDFGNPPPGSGPATHKQDDGNIRAEIRRIILEELRSMATEGRSGSTGRSGR
jgi:hypothetical protein